MSLWATLKASIDAVITTNNANEISGADVRGRLNAMVDDLGKMQFKGIATTTDTPPSYEGAQFWLAETEGNYTNFGNITVNVNEIAFLINNGTGWEKESVTINADKWTTSSGTKIEPADAAINEVLIDKITSSGDLELNGTNVKIGSPFKDSADVINDGSKVLSSDASGNPLWIEKTGYYNYQVTTTVVDVDVTATGTGVFVTGGSAEITIIVPAGVDLIELKIDMPSSATSVKYDYWIIFDYIGLRDYNTSPANLKLPLPLMGSADFTGVSRTNPVIFSYNGNANVDMAVTSYGGGDGSDLEIGFYDFLIDANQILILKF